ncbi:MAG: CotH kinase family protein [Bacteroides sp.]|nr:CotH kinase family protein [Bacteroides sp.]
MNRYILLSALSIFLLFGSYSPNSIYAQDLPEQLSFNEDTSRLIYGGLPSSGFYDEGVIESINIDFYEEDFWQQMLDNFDTEEYVLATLQYGEDSFDSVAVQFKGQTSFTKPSKAGSEKLSFSLKLNEHIEGQDIEGYNNFNLNNAYQDFSFMREVLYGSLSRDLVPALKGNFIRLYLNGEDWGLYTNIQQLNGDYIKEWFFDKDGIRWRADTPMDDIPAMATEEAPPGGGPNWGDGTAALNYLGDTPDLYQNYYTLKDSDMENPWDYLLRVCDVLNNTDSTLVYDSLKAIMDIDATLWFLAREIAFSDDDSYIHKGKMDYYLYLNEETGKMTPLEFDGNSAMSARNVEWSPFINEENENYPLLNILLSVPELRQRYIAHMKTLLELALDPVKAKARIDQYEALIAPELQTDPKIDFTFSDFTRNVNRLKIYFDSRAPFILSASEFQNDGPEIGEVLQWQDNDESHSPRAHEEVRITASATHPDGLHDLILYYSPALTGDFEPLGMNDEGSSGDETAGDGIFSALIPGLAGGSFVRYYLEAVADDDTQTVSYLPVKAEYEVFVYKVKHKMSENSSIVINELMASNSFSKMDEAGEYDDWIELHNTGFDPVSLGGYHLSDNAGSLFKWMFPDTTISANGYLAIWADEDGDQGSMHASFKLSASGEELILTDADSAIVDRIVFSEQEADLTLGRWPNGVGSFVEMPATYQAENLISVTDIQTESGSSSFEVYPNPTDGFIHIRCSSEAQAEIQIFNSSGILIYREKFTNQIDLSHLGPGLYILKSGQHISKLIKQ